MWPKNNGFPLRMNAFSHVLEDLAIALHQLQCVQLVPGFEAENASVDFIILASRLNAEQVQLWYQMAVNGRRDLAFAPSPRAGFEMSLLRMLAFRPGHAELLVLPAVLLSSPAGP